MTDQRRTELENILYPNKIFHDDRGTELGKILQWADRWAGRPSLEDFNKILERFILVDRNCPTNNVSPDDLYKLIGVEEEKPVWCNHLSYDESNHDWRIKNPDGSIGWWIKDDLKECPIRPCGAPKPGA